MIRNDHLNNRTVGFYFAEDVINKVVMKINEKVDISKLFDFLRNMATEGKKSATVSNGKQNHDRPVTFVVKISNH